MLKQNQLNNCYKEYYEQFPNFEIVVGDGCLDSSMVLIGEAPGKDEVIEKKPFVGKAGKNLAEFLSYIEIKREDIFITNAIKYRLGKQSEKSLRVVNRPATILDISSNRGFLIRELSIINPKLIVTLGNVPLRAVMDDNKLNIGDLHGKVSLANINKEKIKIFPLYHPASIIYNPSLKIIYKDDLDILKQLLRSEGWI